MPRTKTRLGYVANPHTFWAMIKIGTHDECWPWMGCRDKNGYGRCTAKATVAHRVAWTLAVGPIPPGLFALHHCDNPPCCNPTHLYIGTLKDNARDRTVRKRYRGGAPRKLDYARAKELRDAGWTLKAIGEELGGVGAPTVHRALKSV